MSSEAFSGGEIAPVIPIHRGEDSADIIDFSVASTDLVVEMLFTNLRHPKCYALPSDRLAAYIDSEFTTDESDPPTSPKARLAKIISANAIDDDAIYERKVETDPVFGKLVELLQTTRGDKDLTDQRQAALHLLGLRAAVPEDETGADSEWLWVLERLFPSSS